MEQLKIYKSLGISEEVFAAGERLEQELMPRFLEFEKTAELNQLKVLGAMQKNRVSAECFQYSTGYGYNDNGRDTLERVYADTFHTEAALVRPQITCGTHALALALSANLRPGDELLSPVGKPYDTLEEVIGIRPSRGSLAEYGVTYRQVELKEDGYFDYPAIERSLNEKTKLVTIQRSKGYQTRPSYSVEKIGELIAFIKRIRPDVICMVDNCYGEFVEPLEPTHVGADLAAGSLIKNPGGGLAPTGGYIAGRRDLVEGAAMRLTVPGIGGECGCTLGQNRLLYQGLFLAPHTVAQAVKTAVFAARVMELLGYETQPHSSAVRHDIIQMIHMREPEALKKFCKGIQFGAPVDSYVTPEPWDMPGYDCQVIMAAGAFIQGASIELSADAPMREPYTVYLQGGLTFESGRLGVLLAVQELLGDSFSR